MISQQDIIKYQEMGFTLHQIQAAAKTANEKKIDILDLLLKSSPPVQPNRRPQQGLTQTRQMKPQASFRYRPYFKPKNKLRTQKYNCVYRQDDGGVKQHLVVEEIREKGVPPVLENVSNCCYLNSLLMAYYLMPELVKIVMKAVPLSKSELDSIVTNNIKNKRIENQYNLLRSIQSLFANLTLSTKKMLSPADILQNLVDHFGNKIDYGEEKDLNEMNGHFTSRLQECLYYTKQNLDNLRKEGVISSGLKSTINQNQREKQKGMNRDRKELKDVLFGTKIEISTQDGEVQQKQFQFLSFLLNPVHGNLYKCLDEQFHYQINDEGNIIKKDVWIDKQPEYLLFYFQRTGFNKNTGAVKLRNRIDFDFQIYLDRYLYKNKEAESKKNPILIEHIRKRDELNKQIFNCRSLIQSLLECHESSKLLSKQIVELPSVELPNQYLESLLSQLKVHEKSISELESRKDPYSLKYIIMHRGSISSGHYWGYGYSGEWWRYDLQNSRIDEENIKKQIDNGDNVVYALIYTRSKLGINPSYGKFLKVPEPDLLNIEEYYDWISEDTQTQIVKQNVKRQQAFEQRRIWESFEQITLEYDQMISEANRTALNIQKFGGQEPYLSSFPVYLRSKSKQPSNSFKLFCLDSAIKKVTNRYSFSQQPNENFSNQLKQVIKNNISSQNIPNKFVCSKFDIDKLKEHEQQFQKRVKMRLFFNLLFENLKNQKWSQSADCCVLILKQNIKDCSDYNYAKQLLSVLILKLHKLGQTVPKNYIKCLSQVNQGLCSKITNIVNVTEIVDTAYQKSAIEIISKRLDQIAHNIAFQMDINKIHFQNVRDSMLGLKPIVEEYKKLV